MRKTKQDWLEEGLNTLAQEGASALKLDRLIARMGVTKGSFYHHFKNFQSYKIALLDWIEQEGTLRIIEIIEQEGTAEEKFDHLMRISADEPRGIEVAVRAWALQDALARDYQERIDQQRLAYVETLCQDRFEDPTQVKMVTQMLYGLYIGLTHMVPPVKEEVMIAFFDEFKQRFKLFD